MKTSKDIQTINIVYVPLIAAFLRERINPEDFVQRYMNTLKNDPSMTYDDLDFAILQAIFEDCDAYWPDPDPSNEGYEIGEDELRRCCIQNLEKLKRIVETNTEKAALDKQDADAKQP